MRHATLKTLVSPFLHAVKGKMPETFGVAVIDEKKAVGIVLDSIGGPDRFCFNIAEGFVFPLHTSAPGKALVAALPEKRRTNLLGRLSFKRFTPNTIMTRKAFEDEIAHIRATGYATDLSEETEGCHCGGVAILGPQNTPVAALWVTGMAKRLSSKHLIACIKNLQATARQIENELAKRSTPPRKGTIHSPCVAAARKSLAAKPCEPADYAALAKSCGVSYSTLRTAFRTETGNTLGQYQLGLRLDEARRLLVQTDKPITEIAERSGFCNQKHFSSLFKRKAGVTPFAYRKIGG
jgi:DNA-binding IclR family transcriptional regulator